MEKTYNASSISSLIGFEDEQEKFEFQKEMLSLKFVKVIEDFITQNKIKKKDLADKMDYSPSYISQVFCANKFVNMDFLVRTQNALGHPFDIKLGDYKEDDSPIAVVYNSRHDVLKNKDKYKEYHLYHGIFGNEEEELLEG
jgi:transcriptional regulator with XRE-family HTH domain